MWTGGQRGLRISSGRPRISKVCTRTWTKPTSHVGVTLSKRNFDKAMEGSSSPPPDSIQVCVRARPLTSREIEEDAAASEALTPSSGETSPLAWQILQPCIDDFMTVSDESAAHAMRCLAYPTTDDIPMVSGESGAAGLAGLQTVLSDVAVAQSLGIDATSRILLISTEGATAPSVYYECVGKSADAVVARQS